MYCPKCGKQIEPQRFCKYCGTKLSEEPAATLAEKRPSSRRRLPVVVLAIVLVAALGCGLGVYFISNRGTKGSSSWQEQYDLGIQCLADEDYEGAVLAFEAVLEIEPQSTVAYRGLAEAYRGLGDEDAAEEVLERGERYVDDLQIEERPEASASKTPASTPAPDDTAPAREEISASMPLAFHEYSVIHYHTNTPLRLLGGV